MSKKTRIRLEDHWMMFHAECGGRVTGELGGKLTCSECGAEMRRFVSDSDEVRLVKEKDGKAPHTS